MSCGTTGRCHFQRCACALGWIDPLVCQYRLTQGEAGPCHVGLRDLLAERRGSNSRRLRIPCTHLGCKVFR